METCGAVHSDEFTNHYKTKVVQIPLIHTKQPNPLGLYWVQKNYLIDSIIFLASN